MKLLKGILLHVYMYFIHTFSFVNIINIWLKLDYQIYKLEHCFTIPNHGKV